MSRGVLQRRGKPGQTSAGVGQQLHEHAMSLAKLVLEVAELSPSTHVRRSRFCRGDCDNGRRNDGYETGVDGG